MAIGDDKMGVVKGIMHAPLDISDLIPVDYICSKNINPDKN